jgi:hypothetical protein
MYVIIFAGGNFGRRVRREAELSRLWGADAYEEKA